MEQEKAKGDRRKEKMCTLNLKKKNLFDLVSVLLFYCYFIKEINKIPWVPFVPLFCTFVPLLYLCTFDADS